MTTRDGCTAAVAPDADGLRVTIRLDTAGDAARLYQPAALADSRLGPGPFLVAVVDGRLLAAVPLRGGGGVADPREASGTLLPILELRAAQLRPEADRSRPPLRLVPPART